MLLSVRRMHQKVRDFLLYSAEHSAAAQDHYSEPAVPEHSAAAEAAAEAEAEQENPHFL